AIIIVVFSSLFFVFGVCENEQQIDEPDGIPYTTEDIWYNLKMKTIKNVFNNFNSIQCHQSGVLAI
uniref:Uncharacterized protein n=1 Tax=Echeneis naucrates TaxID=173247 RepID=A0A665TRA2_ECHNA